MANTPQTYAAKFRSLPPEKLAAIIVNEGDYHADAVTAARLELTARMLPSEELDRVYARAEYQKEILNIKATHQETTDHNRPVNTITNSSFRKKTDYIKLIHALQITALIFSTYNIIHIFFGAPVLGNNRYVLYAQLLEPTALIGLLGLSIRERKTMWWWGTIIYACISLCAKSLNAIISGMYYENSIEIDGLRIATTSSLDSPTVASLKLLFVVVLLYLLLRKDTRVACGITKGEDIEMDELDHLL